MNRKEILEKKKQNILEGYELDAKLAPCLKCFKRDGNEFEFRVKEDFNCDECMSEICFVLLEDDEVETPDVMFG